MSPADDLDLDRAHALMMAVLDDEGTDADRRELDALIAGRPDLAAEWQRLRRLKEVTMTMDVRTPPQEVWDRYRTSVLHRTERTIAWTLIAIGVAVLGGGAVWHSMRAFLSPDVPLEVKIGSAALGAGILVLIVSVLRERWVLHRRDPYSKEVSR